MKPEDFGINTYSWNGDLLDVQGDVEISNIKLKKLPFKFGKVGGDFSCSYNQLKTLEGAPSTVGGDFYCSYNPLSELELIKITWPWYPLGKEIPNISEIINTPQSVQYFLEEE